MKSKEYSNGEVTIVWQADKCIHSAICVGGLPNVFNPKARPWIDVNAASTNELIEQVKKCPSGALSYKMENTNMENTESNPTMKIQILKNGPMICDGAVELINADGSVEIKSGKTALCRCGSSSNKPFCDGSHNANPFE